MLGDGENGVPVEGLITGWFGPLTRFAVQRFQCKYEIICPSPDPVLRQNQDLTAYGYVGPKTRAKLNELINLQLTTKNKQRITYDLRPITENRRQTTHNLRQIQKKSESSGRSCTPPVPAHRHTEPARGTVEKPGCPLTGQINKNQ